MESGKMGKKQTDEWKSRAEDLIRAGGNYKSVNDTLLQELKSGIGGSTFRRFKASMFPEEARKGALEALSERKGKRKDDVKSKLWNKGKQKEADESVFADVLNEGIFALIPCPHKNLKIEDVKQINMGGAIVSLVSYYTSVNLSHPIIILVSRAIILVLKVRKVCYIIGEKYSEVKEKARSSLPGQGGVHS